MGDIKRIILVASFFSMFLPQNALAAKDKLPNGQPFQQLQSLIVAQDASIAANQAAISELNRDIEAVNLRIDGIDTELDSVGAQAAANSAEIADAILRIVATNVDLASLGDQVDGNSADIAALQEDIGELIARHQTDIAALYTELRDLQGQIDGLIRENAALAGELSEQVAELRGLINDNTLATEPLLLDVISLNAQVSTNSARIGTLQSWRESVNNQLIGNSAQIDTLNGELAALKSRVDSYHDPCLEEIYVGQTLTGELVNHGECTSDSRTYFGVHYARYYIFTLSSAKTVTIDMVGYNCPDGGTLRDPYMYLHQGGRTGPILTADDDAGCSLSARITRNLGPGTYTIEATSYSRIHFGTFGISVQ